MAEFFKGYKRIIKPHVNQVWKKNRYWIALKYIKPKSNSTTPVIIGPNNEIAVTIQDKKVLVRLHIFLPLPIFYKIEYKPGQKTIHISVTNDKVGRTLLCQSIKKALGPNIHNFQILYILWDWDPDYIISVVAQAIRLQYHSNWWRHAKEVLFEKLNKKNHTLVKLYRVISLLNCLRKVVEKVVAE